MVKLGVLVLALAAVRPASAQMYFGAGATTTAFGSDRAAWGAVSGGVGYAAESGDAYVEVSRSSRFETGETRAMADLYRLLGTQAYGNVRFLITPRGSVHPEYDVLAGVYIDAGGGWEPSAQVRRMQYAEAHATIGTAGLGFYTGARYYRIQLNVAESEGPLGTSAMLTARYYRNDVSFVEPFLAIGREVVDLGGMGVISQSLTVGVRGDFGASGGLRILPNLSIARDDILKERLSLGVHVRVSR